GTRSWPERTGSDGMRPMTCRRVLPGIVLALVAGWCAAQTAAVPGDAPDPAIQKLFKHSEELRRGRIAKLEHQLRGLRRQPASAEVARQITTAEDQLKALQARSAPVVPTLRFPIQDGAIGRLPELTAHVDQILGEDQMLVTARFTIPVVVVRGYQPRRE